MDWLADLTVVAADSSNLLAARNQMAFTLAAHIPFACIGVAFPLIVLIANWRGVWRDDADALRLAQRWSKAVAVTFAVGAVTGTVLSLELGLLWPKMMERYGDVFGIPFGIEGIFFFTEAIFIAIYIYGWRRLSPKAHFWTGVPLPIVGLGGAASVVAANSWMNQPEGFTQAADGTITDVQPLEVIFNTASWYQVPHMILAAYMVAGFLVASIYAFAMLRGRRDRYHRIGFAIPFAVAAIATPIQLGVGDTAARAIARDQPIKFAAMEYVTTTQRHVPEWIFGVYNDGDPKWGIPIPGLDSFLVGFSTDTEVIGLDTVPEQDQPRNKTLIHTAFDLMVGVGTGLMLLVLWWAVVLWRRRRLPRTRWFLRAATLAGPGAVLALWSGWIVTEVGRQPWIVYEKLRVEDAVTNAGGLWFVFAGTVLLYATVIGGGLLVLRTMARRWRREDEAELHVPYGPSPDPAATSAAPLGGGSG